MSGSSRIPALLMWPLVFIGILAVGYFVFDKGPPADGPPELTAETRELLADAERYITQARYRAAVSAAEDALVLSKDLPKALLLAARASAGQQDYPKAIGYYERVPTDDSEESISASYELATIEFVYRTYSRVEKHLLSVLKRDPEHREANRLMAEILDLSGRRWESVPYALEVVRQCNADFDTLLRAADQEQMHNRLAPAYATNARDKEDPLPRLGLSRTALWEGQPDASRTLTEGVIKQKPELIEAHVRLGVLLLDGDPVEFVKWNEALPKQAESHPDVWVARGKFARLRNQTKAAGRCFWEALKRNPNEGPGAKALGQVLLQSGRREDAKPFLDRAAQLAELRKLIGIASQSRQNTPSETLNAIPNTLTLLGRDREAAAWTGLLTGVPPTSDATPRATNASEVLAMWGNPDSNPAIKLDLSDWPLPDFSGAESGSKDSVLDSGLYAAKYEDMAKSVGIDFTFVAAPDPTTQGKRIIELTGGGVGSIDLDLDAWPDVFLTQGGMYPVKPGDDYHDCLYRNTGSGFEDITALAGITGRGFGQGMSVGDFNADGFPDLYVGNNGANQLYVNNGDGTLSDVTDSMQGTRTDWTTSVVMVDVNGDTLPDIYVVNYVQGAIFDLICRTEGVPVICGPDSFDGTPDQFFINLGDGTFADRTAHAEISKPKAKGLGVLVADFEETGDLQFFVANDGVQNFLFSKSLTDSPFQDMTRLAGVATSGDGVPQGCMGVAAADADGDDQLDFFVTNFDGEFNTLYLNRLGSFEDGTRRAKLHDPSYRFVGFGTQFVDGELDGNPDLLVTNGHVADFVGINDATPAHSNTTQRREAKMTYRMPSQYFQNDGTGVFRERFSEDVGDFFDREYLGRGMARLDWNKDGRDDVAITYLDSPVALVTNTSDRTGHFLAVQLVGTATNRDAIGTSVRIRDGEWRRMQQLTGGDGYQCVNERRVVFGLGERTAVPTLEVRWLDGSKQTFQNLPADTELILVQGEPTPRSVPK